MRLFWFWSWKYGDRQLNYTGPIFSCLLFICYDGCMVKIILVTSKKIVVLSYGRLVLPWPAGTHLSTSPVLSPRSWPPSSGRSYRLPFSYALFAFFFRLEILLPTVTKDFSYRLFCLFVCFSFFSLFARFLCFWENLVFTTCFGYAFGIGKHKNR